MKHAQEDTINKVESQLSRIRNIQSLKEKKKGIFYKKSEAFLHFHESENELFADLKENGKWLRMRVSDNNEWDSLIDKIGEVL